MDSEDEQDLPPYALRCAVCEGLDYPGLMHNIDSPYCVGNPDWDEAYNPSHQES